MFVNADEFKTRKKGKKVIVLLLLSGMKLYNILFVYIASMNLNISALWMSCTHQGSELQASGDFLQCPAHGSEFNNKGKITNGPADKDLRTFPVTVNKNELFIDLRRV